MTYQQGLRLVTRSITVYLILCAIGDLLEMPREVMAVRAVLGRIHASTSVYGSLPNAARLDDLHSEMGFLFANVVRMIVWVTLALWFYRCGPKLQRFFGIEDNHAVGEE